MNQVNVSESIKHEDKKTEEEYCDFKNNDLSIEDREDDNDDSNDVNEVKNCNISYHPIKSQ